MNEKVKAALKSYYNSDNSSVSQAILNKYNNWANKVQINEKPNFLTAEGKGFLEFFEKAGIKEGVDLTKDQLNNIKVEMGTYTPAQLEQKQQEFIQHNLILPKIEEGKKIYNTRIQATKPYNDTVARTNERLGLNLPEPNTASFSFEKIGDGWTDAQKNNYYYLLAENPEEAKTFARNVNAYAKTRPVLANPITENQARMEVLAKEISASNAKPQALKYEYEMLKNGEFENTVKQSIENYGSDDFKYQASLGYDKFLKDELALKKEKSEVPLWLQGANMGFTTAQDTIVGTRIQTISEGYRKDRTYMLPNDDWTKEQKDIFGYYYNVDKNAAYSYAITINETINQEKSSKKSAELSEKVTKSGSSEWLHSALSIPANTIGGMAEYLDNLIEYGARGRITTKANLTPQEYAKVVRQAVSENHKWEVGGYDVFDFIYNTAMSGADSLFASIFGNSAGIMLGASAAAGAIDDIKQRGGTDAQAIIGGTVSGIFEGLFEHISLGKLRKMKGTTSELFVSLFKGGEKGFKTYIKQLGKDMAKSMVVNATEEYSTEVANIIYDTLANGNISNYYQMVFEYMNNGESEANARWKAAGKLALQTLEAAASGGLMGLFFGTGETTLAYKNASSAYNANVGNTYRGDVGALIESGLESAEGTKSRQLAEKYQNKIKNGKELSNTEIAKLVKANQKDIAQEQGQTDNNETVSAEQKIALSNVPTQTIRFALENTRGNITFETLGITDTNVQQQFIESGLANENGVVDREALWYELNSRTQANVEPYNAIQTTQGALNGIDTGGVNIPNSNTSNVDSDVSEQYNDNVENNNGGNVNGSQNTDILAGRKISTASRSGNSVRKQSENSKKLTAWLQNGSQEKTSSGNRVAGESGWIHQSNKELQQFKGRFGKSFLGNLRRIALKNTDSVGRVLSDLLVEKLDNTVFKNINGTVLSLYHFTDVRFDKFAYGDIGFHFGTLEAANNRKSDPHRKKNGNETIYKEVYLNIEKPVIIEGDPWRWDAFSVSEFLLREKIFDISDIKELKHLEGFMAGNYSSPASVKLRELLSAKGYDGIIYSNGVEGDFSVIAFYPDQIITVAENGVLKEGVGVTEEGEGNFDNLGTGSIFEEPSLNISNEEKIDMAFGKTTNAPEYSDIIKLGEDLGLNAKDISFTVKFGLTRGNAISKVIKAAFKNNAQYSQYFSDFEKVISTSDMYKNWAETSNKKNTTVLDFVVEVCFGNNKSAQKQLADILSKNKNASKFIPTMFSDIYSKTGNRYGIENTLKDLSYTFTESAYDARHNESDDIFADKYTKDESFWTAKNKNKPHKEITTLKDKILSLFGKNNGEKISSISEIVKLIEESFTVPVSKGKFKEKAYGIYKNKSESIRTKVVNSLPTIAHELGHHLDKKHNLSSLPSISEAVNVLKTERPDYFNSYSPKKHPHEAVAEFVRFYLADRTQAKEMYPNFFGEFEATIRKNNLKDFENIRTIGDKINSYFTADKAERAKTTVLTRAEAKKLNRRSIKLADILEDLEIRFLDDAAALKKVSKKAYDLFYFAKKSSVRAKNTISGYYMSGFDGNLVEMRYKNGDVIKDEKGNPKYVPALAYILDGINDKQTQHDFDEYLIAKHGIYWIKNDLRVYADDTQNNIEFMQSQIERLEKQYPKFKETAENLYSWYRTFIYEYGIKSGLLSKEQYKNMTTKYPCYVPFMRNVEANNRGTKGSLANQSAPIQRASGSGLDILSPIENIVIKIEQFMKAADRNAVMQDIADIADTAEGKGYLLEKVPPSLIPVTVNVNMENGDIIDNAITDTITEFKIANNQGKNVVWVYRNGEKTYYQVHDANLLSALSAMNKIQYNVVTKAAGNITRVFKALTTGGNAVWSLASNAPRDFSSAYKYSTENNPIKFTVDYIKAFKSAFSEAYLGDKVADETIKLYKSMGGGFNNSLSNSGRELKLTIKEIFQKDKGIIRRITADFNFIEMIEKLSDSVETAPRLAEFKRVYEKTGDAKAAIKAAEEITVNFNRSGIHGKVIDQYIPYFNASLQGNRKLASTLAESLKKDGNKSFLVKTVVCGLVKVGLIFAINNLIMGDDDNDEYEKLSAYKKNNFYNIYIGDGKFISIPKAKDTAVFDSFLERIFEIAMKEDVEWGKEIEDFCAYIWLIFGPPLLDDTIGFSTALDLAANKDFTGAPIVPSNLEDLKPEMQYNENTTYIAKSLGKLFGYSPIKIDHIIDSNLGWFGLLNRSLGKEEKDWSLGVKTKIITDNVYSSDSLNTFYDNAEHYASQIKSYPDDMEAAYNNKRYSSIRSIISEMNQYGKEDETIAREYRILAKNYADNFLNEIAASEKLLQLLERTKNVDILPYKSFSAEYSIKKVKYKMDSDDFMKYVEEYYEELEKEYTDILSKGYSDETTVAMLIDAKKDVNKTVSGKYKVK